MLICHERKLINISVPKTGSTSLHYGLMAHLGIKFKLKDNDAHLYHLNAEDVSAVMGRVRFGRYFSFGVVRNPYDRMVSLFHDFRDQRKVIGEISFEEFVLTRFRARWIENIHFLPQTFFLCSGKKTLVSEVYKFEDGLDKILSDVGEIVGFSFKSIEHARRSERDDWRLYYENPAVADCINTAFASDFSTFGYEQIPGE